jgi:hypothetical protein
MNILPCVLAQVDKAPDPGGQWITVMIGLVLLVSVGVASFMSSMRGHQD